MIYRRKFLAGASALLASQYFSPFDEAAASAVHTQEKQKSIRRGIGQGMKLAVQGFLPTSTWSYVNRTGHYCTFRINGTVDVVLPTFHVTKSGEVDFPEPMDFQVSLEVTYQNALTGLDTSKRFPFLFGGAQTGRYNGPGTNSEGHLKGTLVLPDGISIPANGKFGIILAAELRNRSLAKGGIPFTEVQSSYINRYEGFLGNGAGVFRETSFIDNNATMTAMSFDRFGPVITGNGQALTPFMLVVDYPTDKPCPVIFSSSLDYGVGEGQGPAGYGDIIGTTKRNAGMMPRYINEILGYDYVNFSQGGDGTRYTQNPANTVYRDKLLVLANPTHYLEEADHNSLTVSNPGGWSANTAHSQYDIIRTDSSVYMYTKAGISGTIAPPSSSNDPLARYVDGTAETKYMGAYSSSMTFTGVAGTVNSYRARRRKRVRTLVPGIKIIGMGMIPDSSSSRCVTSLTSSGTVAIATVGNTSDLKTGQLIQIAGAKPAGYNRKVAVTVIDATHFSYSAVNSPTSPAKGTITYSDLWASQTGQTPTSSVGPTPSARSFIHEYDQGLARLDPEYGLDSRITAQWGLETNYAGTTATESGKWASDGVANAYTFDGVHAASRGYQIGAASIQGNPFAS
jgi:hypothetical protein